MPKQLRVERELAFIEKRADKAALRAAWRARDRWLARWERGFESYYARALTMPRYTVGEAQNMWRRPSGPLPIVKADPPPGPGNRPPNAGQVAEAIRAHTAEDQFVSGAQAIYVGLGLDMAEDAGQYTLDALGLNRTFRWASNRDFIRNELAVQGSKIIQHAYGNHIAELANMVIDATDPAKPKSPAELAREVRQRWSEITRRQALRIARTESARIWETTNYNTMLHNDVKQVQWIIATGPSIGAPRSEEVCPFCLARKAASPYNIEDAPLPPEHPNCRCTLVPKLSPTWLPPAEPWTGIGPNPYPVFKTVFSGNRHAVPPEMTVSVQGWLTGGWQR